MRVCVSYAVERVKKKKKDKRTYRCTYTFFLKIKNEQHL